MSAVDLDNKSRFGTIKIFSTLEEYVYKIRGGFVLTRQSMKLGRQPAYTLPRISSG